jgi:hypothetical protein
MRQMTFAIGLVSLALAVSASALAQTSTDTTGKKTPAVQTAESQAAMTPASALEKLKKGNARFVEKNKRDVPARLRAVSASAIRNRRDRTGFFVGPSTIPRGDATINCLGLDCRFASYLSTLHARCVVAASH